MSWKVVVRPEAGADVLEAAAWYDARQPNLGNDFVEEVLQVYDALAVNPFLNSRRHSRKDVRWRLPERFPYRVIYGSLRTRQYRECISRDPRIA